MLIINVIIGQNEEKYKEKENADRSSQGPVPKGGPQFRRGLHVASPLDI